MFIRSLQMISRLRAKCSSESETKYQIMLGGPKAESPNNQQRVDTAFHIYTHPDMCSLNKLESLS